MTSLNKKYVNSTDIVYDNVNINGSTIFRLGSNTTSSNLEVQNNSKDVIFRIDGSGDVYILSDKDLVIGSGSDLTIGHNGTNSHITSTTGNLIVDNTNLTGSTIFRLGSNTNSTNIQVKNNSNSTLFNIDSTGVVTMTNNLLLGDSNEIRLGTGNDLIITHNQTDSVITSTTGNLIIENTNPLTNTIFKLGNTTLSSSLSIKNSSDTDCFTVFSNKDVKLNQRTYTFPSSETIDYYLKTNGEGSLSWAFASTVNSINDLSDVTIINNITNQILTYSGSTWVNTSTPTLGNTIIDGTLELKNDLTINTNKFNINSFSGNTIIGGTLNVSGNTQLDGTLNLNGINYTFPITQTADYYLKNNGSGILTWSPVGGNGFADNSSGSFVVNTLLNYNQISGDNFGYYFRRPYLNIFTDSPLVNGEVESATSTTIIDTVNLLNISGYYVNSLVKITSGSATNDIRTITSYNHISQTFTVNSSFSTTPSINDTYNIYDQLYSALVYDTSLNSLALRYYKNTTGDGISAGIPIFKTGKINSSDVISAQGGITLPSNTTLTFGTNPNDATFNYIGDTFTMTTNNANFSITNPTNEGEYNTFKFELGGNTGKTRFEFNDNLGSPKLTINDIGFVSILDTIYRQDILTTTNSTSNQKIYTYNCRHFNSIMVESDILATSLDASGYSNMTAKTFKMTASFLRNSTQDFTQIGITDKLSMGSQTWDCIITTSGNFLTLKASSNQESSISWKTYSKIIYEYDNTFI